MCASWRSRARPCRPERGRSPSRRCRAEFEQARPTIAGTGAVLRNDFQKLKDLDHDQLGSLRTVRSAQGVCVGNAMRHVDRTRLGVCRHCHRGENARDQLRWRCEAFQELRRRHLPEFAAGDEAALPPILRPLWVLRAASGEDAWMGAA